MRKDTKPGDGMRAKLLRTGITRAMEELRLGHMRTARMHLEGAVAMDERVLVTQDRKVGEIEKLRRQADDARRVNRYMVATTLEKKADLLEQRLADPE